MDQKKPQIAVLGAGSFGTAVANLFSRKGLDVTLWAREPEVALEMREKATNTPFFKGLALEPFDATSDISLALRQKGAVVFAIPCQFLRAFLMKHKTKIAPDAVFINLAKGIEIKTLKTPHEIFIDIFGPAIKKRYCALSGPTFARELYHEVPTGAVIASTSTKTAEKFQHMFSTRFFRLYASNDLMGVELGGALKNIMAICVGIAEGLGYGLNTRAGLMTRCLHEMTELGLAMGAKQRTFAGLSGLGDLILTCTGDLSRNRQVGLRLGRGEDINNIINSAQHVAEGVPTAKAVFGLNKKYKVPMPNAEHVYKILYQGMSPQEAVNRILSRELKKEFLA
ncbi:MAG: NAD(P)-dependent glycerol-3-phosphate dehydrogenase [Deltaproteobacteria bacterium]|nr:NAD(P)-dependent glycerol-3-phosphate dehydrogenase [Deltaproteobacteria bacterium]